MEFLPSKGGLAADALVTQAGRILQLTFSIATLVVLARSLGPTNFGVFSTIVAVQAACFAIADLGLGQLAVRAVAQQRVAQAAAIHSAIPYVYIASSAVLLISCFLSLVLISGSPETVLICLLIGCSYVYAAARIGVERGFWLGAHQFVKATILDMSAAGLRAFAIGSVWLLGGASVMAYSVGLAASGVVTILVVRSLLRYPTVEPVSNAGVDVLPLLRESAPFALTSLTWNSVAELPKIVLASSAGARAVGQFAAGARFLTVAQVPLQSLQLVITPRLFTFASAERPKQPLAMHPLLKAVALTTLTGATLAGLVVILAPLLPVLLGLEYRPAVPVLRILALSLPFHALASATGDWLGGVGRQQLRFALTLGTLLLAVPVLILGSRAGGAYGAATGYTLLLTMLAIATTIACLRLPER
jgi:O-antigen/teichoic acid export membrane protein